jgi:hypothetical protein
VFFILIYSILNEKLFAGKDKKVLGLLFFLGFVPIGLFGLILLRLKFMGNLWAGSANGLWNATVKTLIQLITTSDAPVFSYFIIFYSTASLLLFLLIIIKKKDQNFFHQGSIVFLYLLAGNLGIILILGKIFHINYPEDRIGLYLFPLFLGCFLFLLDQAKVKNFYLLLLIVLPLYFLPAQFILRFNLTYFSFYFSDNIPYRFYNTVYSEYKSGEFPPTIGGYKGRHFCWSYLNYRKGGNLSEVYYSNYPGYECDFQIADISDNPAWRNYYDSVDYDKYSGRQLLKRRLPLKKILIASSPTFSTGGEVKPEFFQFFRSKVDSLAGQTLYLTYDMTLECPVKPFVAWVVATVNDSTGQNLLYERIPLDWLRTEWKGPGNNFRNVLFLSDLPQGSYNLDTYIWNMDKVPYRVSNGRFTLYKVIRDWK